MDSLYLAKLSVQFLWDIFTRTVTLTILQILSAILFLTTKLKLEKYSQIVEIKKVEKSLTLLQHILPSSFVNSLQIHVFGFTYVNKSCMLMVIIYSDNDKLLKHT